MRNNGLFVAGLLLRPDNLPLQIVRLLPPAAPDGHGTARVADALRPNAQATFKGFLGKQLQLSYQNRILAQDYKRLIAPFKVRTETHLWQTEFWGKWFTSAVLAYRYHPTVELKTVLDDAVQGLLATQSPDGYIGNYAPDSRLEQWDIWGMKYCLMGLLDYYGLTQDKAVLSAGRNLADYLINTLRGQNKKIVQMGNYRGMAASSVLGAICQLYRATGEEKYLHFAQEIVAEWETPEGPQLISKSQVNVAERFPKPPSDHWYSYAQGAKAYEMMSCYEGLLDLYRLTGHQQYKTAAEKTWENISRTEMNIAGSGASMECWFGGKALQTERIVHYQETCVSVTWIRLSLNLFMLTGDPKYADAVECSYYNALLGSMYPDGATWAKYTPLEGQRLPGSGQCGMALNCCVANGPRGLFALPSVAVASFDKGFSVNFYNAGRFRLQSPGGQQVEIAIDTDYPAAGEIALNVRMPAAEEMTMRLRIPAWSRVTHIQVNGKVVTGMEPGTFMDITRRWKTGDTITLDLDMRGRVVSHGDKDRFKAVVKGPVVLAQDSRFAGNEIINTLSPVVDKEGYVALSAASIQQEGVWMQYRATFLPESYTEEGPSPRQVTLINYSSAGYGKDASTYRVWIPQLFNPRSSV